MNNKYFENRYAHFRRCDHIVFIQLKSELMLNIEMAETISTARLFFQNDKTCRVLFDINALAASNKTGRDYLAQYGWFLADRVSILAHKPTPHLIALFYLKISKPRVMTEIFTDTASALKYLKDNP